MKPACNKVIGLLFESNKFPTDVIVLWKSITTIHFLMNRPFYDLWLILCTLIAIVFLD